MSVTPNRRNPSAVQPDSVSVTRFNHVEAEKAYLVYAAMKRAEVRETRLTTNLLWNVLKALSYEIFLQAFEVQQ